MTSAVCVVTGAGGGIGAAVVEKIASNMAVLAIDVDAAGLDRLAPQGDSKPITSVQVDIRDEVGIENALNVAEEQLGPITALVNAAGTLNVGSVRDTPLDSWEKHMSVNATGVFTMSRAVSRRMRGRGGAVVTIASNAAHTPRPGLGPYAASKSAAAMITKCLGLELAAEGIRCNVVAPGSTDTPMLTKTWDENYGLQQTIDGSLAQLRLPIPLGRIADTADIANAVAFLLSDDARHITVETITVDGGATLGMR